MCRENKKGCFPSSLREVRIGYTVSVADRGLDAQPMGLLPARESFLFGDFS